MYRTVIKPIADFVSALIILCITSPVWVVTMIVLGVVNGGSPFFFQPRPGRNGKIFTLIKFKTMTDAKGPDGELLPDADRLTKFGNAVRKLSIDELPQLFNVLKGDMSIVGPRPLLVEYLPRYNDIQKRRHEVRGGITGWAQVNGRNTISWEKKFEYDVYYVDHQTFFFDIRILWLTVINVLKREGISSATSATMEKFTGRES